MGAMEHGIHHQPLVRQAQRAQLIRGAGRLIQRAFVGPGYQHHGGLCGVVECGQGCVEKLLLHFQARVRPQAGCAAVVAFQKTAPGLGQAQQPERVPRGGRVEHDVVIGGTAVRQEAGKFVKRGDFGCARARQLLAHRGNVLVAGLRAHLPHHARTVIHGRGIGVDVEHLQAGHAGHRHRLVAQLDAQHFIEVGGGVRADQQHLFARVCQPDRHGSGNRGFTHAALARKEKVFGGLVEKGDGCGHGIPEKCAQVVKVQGANGGTLQ